MVSLAEHFRAVALSLITLVLLGGCQHTPQTQGSRMTPATTSTTEDVVEALGLEGHVEGGYYRRTYEASHRDKISTDEGDRFLMTSIFYLLAAESPVGHFHLNRSDIVHYFHLGDPIEYFLIYPDGRLETVTMGHDITRGQQLQLTVKGGVWKASRLTSGSHGYGLISEAVSPGFDFADMTLGEASQLSEQFPQHAPLFPALTHK